MCNFANCKECTLSLGVKVSGGEGSRQLPQQPLPVMPCRSHHMQHLSLDSKSTTSARQGEGPLQANYLIKWTINTRSWSGGMSNVCKSENICKLICAQDANCLLAQRHTARLHGRGRGNISLSGNGVKLT